MCTMYQGGHENLKRRGMAKRRHLVVCALALGGTSEHGEHDLACEAHDTSEPRVEHAEHPHVGPEAADVPRVCHEVRQRTLCAGITA